MNRTLVYTLVYTMLAVLLPAIPVSAELPRWSKGQVSQLTIVNVDGSGLRIRYQVPHKIEAPNWTKDGKWLIFNSKGRLWKLALEGDGPPRQIDTGRITSCNNDHLLSPDGRWIYFSAAPGHIYAVPFEGGTPRRITNDSPPEQQVGCWLHGVSPDGKTLVYTRTYAINGKRWAGSDIYAIPVAGGKDRAIVKTEKSKEDGPEFSPDGKWIYFNSTQSGSDQIWRIPVGGGEAEQITDDDRVNWFPHFSPDGEWIVYLSYGPGTRGHPLNRDVILRRMR
ncbi:MAG: hypothetical protein MI757_14735, partial [Pirellulales bacterium]|nr:hypothetical protein [Pirellulales bacterium]